MKKYIVLVFITLTTSLRLVAQTAATSSVSSSEWTTMFRINSQNQIMLKWFPKNPTDWKFGIENGYTIQRNKYNLAGVLVQTTNIPIAKLNGKDSTSVAWSPFWKNDSTFHQQLFRLSTSSNKITRLGANDVVGLDTLSERYFYANILADLSFSAAQLCGLGYTDKMVEKGFSYDYIIKINTKSSQTLIGRIPITSEPLFIPLPDIPKPTFEAKPRKLTLSWKTTDLSDSFSSYSVQRADKGATGCANYKTLNTSPLIDFSGNSTFFYYSDSLPNQTKTYCYRVIGNGFFDERKGGAVAEYQFKKQLEHAPIVNAVSLSGGNVKVDWEFNGPATDVSSFRIAVSKVDTAKRGQTIFKEFKTNILATSRTLSFPSLDLVKALGDTNSVYYLFVGAQAEVGSTSIEYSYPYVISPMDKLPPSAPLPQQVASTTSLAPFSTFEVLPQTSNGNQLLKLRWIPSTDNPNPGGVGLMGYRVYRLFSNQPAHLKVEISGGIINRTEYVNNVLTAFVVDTIGANFSYPSVTYFVSALDYNYNESAVTTYQYQKPDLRRPSPPIIHKFVTTYTTTPSVKLEYILPTEPGSKIIFKLLKKENSLGSSWSETLLDSTSKSYTDTQVKRGSEYVYSIQAVDAAKNSSCFKTPTLPTNVSLHDSCYQLVVANVPDALLKPAVTTFSALYQEEEKNMKLTWTYSQPNVVNYEIYKGVVLPSPNVTKTALLDYCAGTQLTYFDPAFEIGKAYKYQIRAIFQDGSVSEWKEISTAPVVQKLLAVNINELLFTTKNESKPILISSNISWTVTSSNPTWLQASLASGSNDGSISISTTLNSGNERSGVITITGGGITQEIRVLQLGVPNGNGLTAKYYNQIGLAAIQGKLPDIVVLDPIPSINTNSSPKVGINENFVAVWEGFIQVKDAATYTFYVSADDGFNLYFDNALVQSGNAYNIGVEFQTKPLALAPGVNYPIKIEYWDDASFGGFSLKWSNNTGLGKQVIPSTHFYPLFIPEPLSADPLNNKCFVIRNLPTGKVLQLMPNFLVQQQALTNNNNQIWKFEKLAGSYKIISQIDQQGKVIQVLGGGKNNADKIIGGYFNNANHQLWDVSLKNSNLYSFRQKGTTSAFLEIADAGMSDQAIIYNFAEREYRLEPIGCPSTSNTIVFDKSYVSLGSLPSSDQVVITTGLGWSATVSDSWLQVNKPGGYGNGTLTISASQNNNFVERKGVVKILAGNTYYDIYVTQFASPSGSGLDAKYFNSTSFTSMASSVPVLSRIDESINFSWGGSPGPGVNADFAARWEGFIEAPMTSDYTFFVASNDGCRLWINGELIINDNSSHPEIEFKAIKAIKMIAGQKYLIKLEFWDGASGAALRLRWENTNGLSKQIVEKKYLYPSGISISTNSLTFLKNGGEKTIALFSEKPWQINGGGDWIIKSPQTGSKSGQVTISVGQLLGTNARSENLTFTSGGTTKVLQVAQYPTNANGLTASYFNVIGFSAMQNAIPVLKKIDEQVDFSWSASPGLGVNNDFSARWEGYVSPPETGNYRFFSASDDGVRLFVNDIQTVYDNNPHGEIEFSSDRTFYMEKGKLYPIKMEFWDSGGGAAARLRWANDVGLSKQIIAKQYLFTAE